MKTCLQLVIIFFTVPFFSLGQPPKIKSDPSHELKYRKRGKLWEGFVRAQVSSNDLELVNFTFGHLNFSPEKPEVIPLKLLSTIIGEVKVKARGIPRDLFYQMDSQLRIDETLDWSTGEVLIKIERTRAARNIGVFGYIDTENQSRYFPLVTHGNANQTGTPTLKFICSTRVKDIQWRFTGQATAHQVNGGYPIRKGRPIVIKLPPETESGKHTLEITAREYYTGEIVSKIINIGI